MITCFVNEFIDASSVTVKRIMQIITMKVMKSTLFSHEKQMKKKELTVYCSDDRFFRIVLDMIYNTNQEPSDFHSIVSID